MAQRLLFQKLPVSLFALLAAPLAELYADVLLRIFTTTQQHQEPLSWELCISLIVETIEDRENSDQLAQLNDSLLEKGEESTTRDARARATELLRNLKQYQWLREEIQAEGTLIYSLPETAFRLLRVFHEIATGREEQLQGVICNIHDLLQAAVQKGNASVRIPQALQETNRLLSHLKELQHTIGLHIEQVLKQTDLNGILEQTFITYLHQVTRTSYHEMRTTDHVSRFRLAIYEAISLLRIRYQGTETTHLHQEFLPAQELLRNLEEIEEQFDRLDDLLQAIDIRHSQFFDAAVRAIQLKLSATTRTSGHLYTILQTWMQTLDDVAPEQQDDEDTFSLAFDQLFVLHSLEWLDKQSLMAPRRPPEPFVPAPDETRLPSEEEIEAARQATLQRLSRAYSRERVRRFAHKILGNQDEQRIGELSLTGPDDLPMLMYLRRYGHDGMLGYVVVELEHALWIEQADIGFRDFLIRRVLPETSPPIKR